MKTIFRILAAGLAASLALVSCAKQEAMDNGSTSPAGGARTIAVSFANASVKSALGEDGLTPKFVAGDIIKVSNGIDAPEDCTVEIDGSGNASITTSLTGELTAVYPSTAAKMNGNAIEGVIVPTVQDGTFASANICKATIAEGATSATFENQTAIFKLSVPAKDDEKGVDYVVKSLAVKSIGENNIAEGSKEIKVGDGTSTIAAENGFYYVSVLPGETSSNLYVCAGAGARKLTGADAIAENKIYSVALPVLNGHEYVEITMTVGGTPKTYKWATMNIGATSSTDAGLYFMWGETSGMPASSISPTNFPASKYYTNADNSSWDKTKGFGWANAPWTDGVYEIEFNENVFTKYTGSKNAYAKSGTADGKTTLELEDDAANANWGGSWRMPTTAEFDALVSETKVWDSTNKGFTFGTYPNTIFLPAAGFGGGTDLVDTADYGCYWSSSLYTNANGACLLYFYVGYAETGYTTRWDGQPVRAVWDKGITGTGEDSNQLDLYNGLGL